MAGTTMSWARSTTTPSCGGLLPYLRPYRGRAYTAIFAMIVFAAVSRTQPFLIGLAIDKYIKNQDLQGVAFIGLALLGLAVAGWLAQWVQQVMTAFMGHRILLRLRTQMFNHIQKLSLSFLDAATRPAASCRA